MRGEIPAAFLAALVLRSEVSRWNFERVHSIFDEN